jgi:uncharacterized membrane protein YphA (DoxX/SURF4 family)
MSKLFERVDIALTHWMARHGIVLLRISLGIVFFWFGVLKFFASLSPAQDLATRTIDLLSFGLVAPGVALPVLAAWECAIGLGLISGWAMRATLFLLFAQMAGTITRYSCSRASASRAFPTRLRWRASTSSRTWS